MAEVTDAVDGHAAAPAAAAGAAAAADLLLCPRGQRYAQWIVDSQSCNLFFGFAVVTNSLLLGILSSSRFPLTARISSQHVWSVVLNMIVRSC